MYNNIYYVFTLSHTEIKRKMFGEKKETLLQFQPLLNKKVLFS